VFHLWKVRNPDRRYDYGCVRGGHVSPSIAEGLMGVRAHRCLEAQKLERICVVDLRKI
jgi:hypothetical protein